MSRPVSDIAFTPSVKDVQHQMGSRTDYALMEQRGGWQNTATPMLESFLAERDTFFLGTVSSEGQPYIQHRGGPKGFLKVLDERTLAFGDFEGNRQYITVGNLEDSDKAFIFLPDFANRQRVKVWGRARMVDDDPGLLKKVSDPAYGYEASRAVLFTIVAWDANCPQHITPRYTTEEMEEIVQPLRERIAELEEALEALKSRGES